MALQLTGFPDDPDHQPASEQIYQDWRRMKLDNKTTAHRLLPLASPDSIDEATTTAIRQQIAAHGFALYQLPADFAASRNWLLRLGQQFGLSRLDSNLCADEDSISILQVEAGNERKRGYIPYTDRPLNWHTDGYYNGPDQQIGAFILHCAQDAAEGGENGLLDPELAYIRLYDENPAYIEALSHPEAMSIPPNMENGAEIHGWISGPVFSFSKARGLHMRYTARRRNIRWRDDPTTLEAVAFLQNLLDSGENDDIIWQRLSPGQGVICNNVLHCRKAFRNSPQRQRRYYRARYLDRIRRT